MNRTLYFGGRISTLDNVLKYDYDRFEDDADSGKIAKEEMSIYRAMNFLYSHDPDYKKYLINLRGLVTNFALESKKPDGALLDSYTIFLQDMAMVVRMFQNRL